MGSMAEPTKVEPPSGRRLRHDCRRSSSNGLPLQRIFCYRNGDEFFSPKKMVVSHKRYRTWEALLKDLTKAVGPGVVSKVGTPLSDALLWVGDTVLAHEYGWA